jgi:hypothetical protein
VLAVRPKAAKAHVAAPVKAPRAQTVSQKDSEQQRDRLLLALLRTPPQPRPKRERDKAKLNYAKRAKTGKSAQAI